jgi:hypothetical protein
MTARAVRRTWSPTVRCPMARVNGSWESRRTRSST